MSVAREFQTVGAAQRKARSAWLLKTVHRITPRVKRELAK